MQVPRGIALRTSITACLTPWATGVAFNTSAHLTSHPLEGRCAHTCTPEHYFQMSQTSTLPNHCLTWSPKKKKTPQRRRPKFSDITESNFYESALSTMDNVMQSERANYHAQEERTFSFPSLTVRGLFGKARFCFFAERSGLVIKPHIDRVPQS